MRPDDTGGLTGFNEYLCNRVSQSKGTTAFVFQLERHVWSCMQNPERPPYFTGTVVALMFTSTKAHRKMTLGSAGEATIGDLVDRGYVHAEPWNLKSG